MGAPVFLQKKVSDNDLEKNILDSLDLDSVPDTNNNTKVGFSKRCFLGILLLLISLLGLSIGGFFVVKKIKAINDKPRAFHGAPKAPLHGFQYPLSFISDFEMRMASLCFV